MLTLRQRSACLVAMVYCKTSRGRAGKMGRAGKTGSLHCRENHKSCDADFFCRHPTPSNKVGSRVGEGNVACVSPALPYVACLYFTICICLLFVCYNFTKTEQRTEQN